MKRSRNGDNEVKIGSKTQSAEALLMTVKKALSLELVYSDELLRTLNKTIKSLKKISDELD